jgi:hypothetical protein
MTCRTETGATAVCSSAALLFSLALAGCGAAQSDPKHAEPIHAVAWPLDDLTSVGGYRVNRVGAPTLLAESPGGVCLGGSKDGLLFPVNPLDAQYEFTVQALVRPAPGGELKQQFLHLQDEDGENRVLLETRTTGSKWQLHAFVKSGEAQADIDATGSHPTGEWSWVALTQEEGTFRLYVNGQQEGTANVAVVPMKRGEMAVGFRLSRENWFTGCVSELRFATAALPSTDLASEVPSRTPAPAAPTAPEASPSGATAPPTPAAPATESRPATETPAAP